VHYPVLLISILLALGGCSNLQNASMESRQAELLELSSAESEEKSTLSMRLFPIPQSAEAPAQLAVQKDVTLIERAVKGFEWADYRDQEQVDYWINRYLSQLDQFEAVLDRAEPFLFYILNQFEVNDLPAELAFLPFVESGFRPEVASWSGAAGLWQFMPATGRSLGLDQDWWTDERLSVDQSTLAAIRYLSYLHSHFDEDWFMALAAYNTGEGNLRKVIRNNDGNTDYWTLKLNSETASYVPKLLAVVYILKHAPSFNLDLPDWPNQTHFEIFQADRQLDLEAVASHLKVEQQYLLSMNAHYPQKITAPNQSARIALPAELIERMDAILDSLPEVGPLSWTRYQVRSGDNLSVIADRMGVTVRDITQANQLKSILIHPGDDLLIPRPDVRISSQPVTSALASVRSGDSPWLIARRYGVGLSDLLAANDLNGSEVIHPGQLLKLPSQPSGDAQITHEVRSGDSLYDIAVYYGVGLTDLKAWNALGSSNLIRPGDELTIWLRSESQI